MRSVGFKVQAGERPERNAVRPVRTNELGAFLSEMLTTPEHWAAFDKALTAELSEAEVTKLADMLELSDFNALGIDELRRVTGKIVPAIRNHGSPRAIERISDMFAAVWANRSAEITSCTPGLYLHCLCLGHCATALLSQVEAVFREKRPRGTMPIDKLSHFTKKMRDIPVPDHAMAGLFATALHLLAQPDYILIVNVWAICTQFFERGGLLTDDEVRSGMSLMAGKLVSRSRPNATLRRPSETKYQRYARLDVVQLVWALRAQLHLDETHDLLLRFADVNGIKNLPDRLELRDPQFLERWLLNSIATDNRSEGERIFNLHYCKHAFAGHMARELALMVSADPEHAPVTAITGKSDAMREVVAKAAAGVSGDLTTEVAGGCVIIRWEPHIPHVAVGSKRGPEDLGSPQHEPPAPLRPDPDEVVEDLADGELPPPN